MITVDAEILSSELQIEVEFPAISIGGVGGGSAIVVNSNLSYSETVAAGQTLTLPNEELKVFVNGELNQTTTYIPLSNQTINIQ
jgi:hypothetical protein